MSYEIRIERLEAEMEAAKIRHEDLRSNHTDLSGKVMDSRAAISDKLMDVKIEIIDQILGLRTDVGSVNDEVGGMKIRLRKIEKEVSRSIDTGEVIIQTVTSKDDGSRGIGEITFKERTLYIIAILAAAGVAGAGKLIDIVARMFSGS